MNHEDRNHTTSWDGSQVRQAASNAEPQRQEQPYRAPAGQRTGKKKKKK